MCCSFAIVPKIRFANLAFVTLPGGIEPVQGTLILRIYYKFLYRILIFSLQTHENSRINGGYWPNGLRVTNGHS